MRNLRHQHPTYASPSTKIRLSILSTAIVDALGFANEFTSRFAVPFLCEMKPNPHFSNVPAGSWTDDTSMMLCLAQSISSSVPGRCDPVDQMKRYVKWRNEGHLSSVGYCFDVGVQIGRAIYIFSSFDEEDHEHALDQIRRDLGGEMTCGNGSLMRVLPVGLFCWRYNDDDDEDGVEEGKRWAALSSQTTHPNTMCVEACQLWTCLIMKIMREMAQREASSVDGNPPSAASLSKLDLLKEISKFPFTDPKLREALTVPNGVVEPNKPTDDDDEHLEAWYWQHHPLLKLIATTQKPSSSSTTAKKPSNSFPYTIPPTRDLSSSGYVLNTLVAALYCFFTTRTFEDGALMAVNLCDDADTVGAVYAGLAGCWYAAAAAEEEESKKGSAAAAQAEVGSFWSDRVRRWMGALKKWDVVESVADQLANACV